MTAPKMRHGQKGSRADWARTETKVLCNPPSHGGHGVVCTALSHMINISTRGVHRAGCRGFGCVAKCRDFISQKRCVAAANR